MGFNCGIVGLPNVGKSCLFNALTRSAVAAENYPFCTIDPNVGVVAVPDFIDIAGLVAGASRGEGLGNQFLAHIRETQAIAHVVRCFEDDNVAHVAGRIDPLGDIEVIDTELALADLETVARAIERAEKQSKAGDRAVLARLASLRRAEQGLDNAVPVRAQDLDDPDREAVGELRLLTAKPVLYVANVGESDIDGNGFSDEVATFAGAHGSPCVTISAELEAELAALDEGERDEFLRELGIAEPGLDRFIRAGYQLLGLRTFFSATPKECRAWTIRAGATAVAAAGVIHTDFARGFIRAEVVGYDEFIRYDGEAGAREAGRLRLEGKDYVVQDGDVIHFRFNV
jgi:GTP-binding protein YchF